MPPPWKARLFLWSNALGAALHWAGVVVALALADLTTEVPLLTTRADLLNASVCVRIVEAARFAPGFLAPLWFAISAAAHTLIAASLAAGRGDWYARALERGLSPHRWLEYAASSSVMVLAAAVLISTRSAELVAACTVSMLVTMLFGLATEANYQRFIADRDVVAEGEKLLDLPGGASEPLGKEWKDGTLVARAWPHLVGYAPFVLSWALLLSSYEQATDAFIASGAVADLRAAPYGALAAFVVFGLPQLVLLVRRDGPSLAWLAELAYICLSITAKVVFAGLLLAQGLSVEAMARAKGVEVRVAGQCAAE